MAAHWWLLRAIQSFEVRLPSPPISSLTNKSQDHIVASILRQPGFHRAVTRIHKTIHEKQHGRNPHEPLAPGEATADPNTSGKNSQFAKHFLDEIKNQFRGKPTDITRK
ncbi:hypothetical protein FOC1_g10002756 [Fusarium oxysporum f. sp. cubense race 1]|uniref:Uncharacterized protein n=1 Tax=Fusarium oxysporum f. sp. cubense (strain race 1) TaxID=1229664 RepID=N4TWA2_FUSC1|nr:hypothetical protein FOC1_g10002756 [Fusarium oxysporum f. sp. cubense race 1]